MSGRMGGRKARSTKDEAPGTEERYLSATHSSDLRVTLDAPCDADKLLAAGYAVSGSDRKALALRIYRLRATGDLAGVGHIAEEMADKIVRHSRRMKSGDKSRIRRVAARDMCMTILAWWHNQTCPSCKGRGHPLIPGTPILDDTRDCPMCHGTGIRPLERLVRHEYVGHARWMVSEMESLCGMVFGDMARLLSNRLVLERNEEGELV